MITNHAEGTIESLRYNLGGDRPSQTTRLAVSLCRIHGKRLELKQNKGGISLVTPSRLAPRLQSLPPMLHMLCPNSMPRYSKASGSFRPYAGNRRLHRYHNFTEPMVETVTKSLHHSCRSELTRQGISLSIVAPFKKNGG